MELMIFFVIIFCVILKVPIVLGDENEYRLVRYLMANYDKSIRPSRNASESLNVTFGVSLAQLIDVDERNQILATNCWLNQAWIDYSLQWNASDFGGIRVVRIPAESIWRPDILLYNNADSQYNSAIISTNAIITSDGNITWLSAAIFKSSCQINVRYFPFDEQNCTMKFASWTYDGFQVDLLINSEEGDLSNYVPNGEWDVINLLVNRNVVYYSCCEEPYPDITYAIQLRRRPMFYVFNLILPCVLITGLALLGFYVPSDSGEKVTLGITTLLSMTVFLMVVGESMPPTSETLPLIGMYYGVTICLVSFATALTVVTLNIHHRGMRGKEVPSIVKKIIFGIIAKILCINLDLPDPVVEPPSKEYQPAPVEITTSDKVDSSDKCENGSLSPRFGHRMQTGATGMDNFEKHFIRVLNKVYQTIEKNEIRLAEQDRRDTVRVEWQQVALVIDRFLLWLFVLTTTVVSFAIIFSSPHARLY